MSNYKKKLPRHKKSGCVLYEIDFIWFLVMSEISNRLLTEKILEFYSCNNHILKGTANLIIADSHAILLNMSSYKSSAELVIEYNLSC